MKDLRVWAVVALLLLASWGVSLWLVFERGKSSEQSAQRAMTVKRERQLVDSIEHARDSLGAIAGRNVSASSSGAATLASIDSGVARRRRVITVVDTNHVLVHDTTTGTSTSERVPTEIVERLQGDSIALDSLRGQTRRDSSTIVSLRVLLRADTLAFIARDSMIVTLSTTALQRPLLDRVIARVTVPLVKAGLVGAVGYGVYRGARALIASSR